MTDVKKYDIPLFIAGLFIVITGVANKNIFIAITIVYIVGILVLTQKTKYVMGVVPFVALSLAPSQYSQMFRLATPLGELRADFIALLVSIGYFFIISMVFGKVKMDNVRQFRGIIISLLLFLLTHIVSAVINNNSFDAIRYSVFIFAFSLGFVLIGIFSMEKLSAERMIKLFILTSTIVSCIGLLEFFGIFQPYIPLYLVDNPGFGSGNALPRIAASIGNPLVLSGYLLLMVPFIMHIRDASSKKIKWNIILLLHFLAILFTQSRSALLMFIIVMFFYSLKSVKKLVSYVFLATVAGLFFYLILVVFGYEQIMIDRLFFRENVESFGIRSSAFGLTAEILNVGNNLLVGTGPNTVNYYLQNYFNSRVQTLDNVYLMTLSSLGIMGLFALAFLFIALIRKVRTIDVEFRKTGHSLILVLAGLGLSFNIIYFTSVWGVFWILITHLISWNVQENKKLGRRSR